MTAAAWAAGFCALATVLQVLTTVLVAIRCRVREPAVPPPQNPPSVSLIRPVCGLDNFARETLGSTFGLDYPRYEILFCVARADDPVMPLVRQLVAAHPSQPARLLIGDDPVSTNPKLNNIVKGWRAAASDWIIMADSNVLMPRDYIQRLLRTWRGDTGVVCAVPIASRPGNFWSELECAFLNTFQARWEYVSDTFGLGFAQGKNMLFRRDIVEAGGGIAALGRDIAEDAATTRLVRAAGKRVRLVDNPFEQPLARRTFAEVWRRQLRWARLRRMTFPLLFMPEILTGCFFPILAGAYVAAASDVSAGFIAAPLLAIWFGAEALLARSVGWHASFRMPLAYLIRDLMLPVLWVAAWAGDKIVWRGTQVSGAGGRLQEASGD